MQVEFNVGANAVIQLGEDLYKNTYGVLIEYITNSYDADANEVEIKINRNKGEIIISDDGIGMSLKELQVDYMDVGLKRRKARPQRTKKKRLVTGRKGFGKLACFGLFKSIKVITVQDKLKSELNITTGYDSSGDFYYNANTSDKVKPTTEKNGTKIYLMESTQNIPEDKQLCDSIAKRLNIMYGSERDKERFIIKLEDTTIDKTYRDKEILNKDIKFTYTIPDHIERFLSNKEDIDYVINNDIKGTIIARGKTVNIKENKGIVLFARGKLCQEATYLDINPSNSYGYAHLYGELHVDFIDNQNEDNIGTDRTALKETETTKKLFEVITKIMTSYATLYGEDEKERKDNAIDEYKKHNDYKNMQKTIEQISDRKLKKEIDKLLDVKIKNSIKDSKVNNEEVKSFQKIAESVTPTYILKSEQISKNDIKDNITTSYDYLIEYLRKKYSYTGLDGDVIFNQIYSTNDDNKFMILDKLILGLTGDTKKNAKASLRELGKAIVSMRNCIYHTSDRDCINNNISIELSKRFLIMIDLFIEIDTKFFLPKPSKN